MMLSVHDAPKARTWHLYPLLIPPCLPPPKLPIESPPNHHPPHLTRPRPNLIQLRIPHQPARRHFIHIPHPPHQLHRIQPHARRILRREQDGRRTIFALHPPLLTHIQRPRRRHRQRPRGRQHRIHIRQLSLHELILRDGVPELGSHVRVRQRDVERRLHEPQGSGAEDEPFDVEPLHEDLDAAVHVAEDVFVRDEDVFEEEFARVGAAHAELVEFAGAGEASGGGGVEDEGRDAFGCGARVGFGVDDYGVGVWALFFGCVLACMVRSLIDVKLCGG